MAILCVGCGLSESARQRMSLYSLRSSRATNLGGLILAACELVHTCESSHEVEGILFLPSSVLAGPTSLGFWVWIFFSVLNFLPRMYSLPRYSKDDSVSYLTH